MLLAALIPLEPYVNSRAKWKCKCERCQAIVYPSYRSIQQGRNGCRYCYADKLRTDKDLAIQVMISNGFKPLDDYVNNKAPWKCKCMYCGNISNKRLNDVKTKGSNCKFCSRIRNRLDSMSETEKKYLVDRSGFMNSRGYETLENYPGAHILWKVRHMSCGKIFKIRYSTVWAGWKGCPKCRKNSPLEASNAVAIMREQGLEPLEPFKSVNYKWQCRCIKCGKVSTPMYATVKRKISGCKYCATKGLNLNTPAYIYLVTNSSLNAHKIGIGGKNDRRLKEHSKNGWDVWKTLDLDNGEMAYKVEQLLLIWLRKTLNIPPYLIPEQMPQGGWTETVDASEIDLATIWTKVTELSKVRWDA